MSTISNYQLIVTCNLMGHLRPKPRPYIATSVTGNSIAALPLELIQPWRNTKCSYFPLSGLLLTIKMQDNIKSIDPSLIKDIFLDNGNIVTISLLQDCTISVKITELITITGRESFPVAVPDAVLTMYPNLNGLVSRDIILSRYQLGYKNTQILHFKPGEYLIKPNNNGVREVVKLE